MTEYTGVIRSEMILKWAALLLRPHASPAPLNDPAVLGEEHARLVACVPKDISARVGLGLSSALNETTSLLRFRAMVDFTDDLHLCALLYDRTITPLLGYPDFFYPKCLEDGLSLPALFVRSEGPWQEASVRFTDEPRHFRNAISLAYWALSEPFSRPLAVPEMTPDNSFTFLRDLSRPLGIWLTGPGQTGNPPELKRRAFLKG